MSVLLRAIRSLARMPVFRALTRFGPLIRLTFALRGALVQDPLRFALNELRLGSRTATYALRESGVAITLRHHTADILVLDEVFSQREYDPPPPALEALTSVKRPLRVVDLGANIGLFGAWALGRFAVERIEAIEPDPANFAVHERTIAANSGRAEWRLIAACAATAEGQVRFHAGEFTTSHLAEAGEEGIVIPAVDVLPLIAAADLVKIDVEGAEWPILLDPRFSSSRSRAFVLEYHESSCPEREARGLAERTLQAAGYEVALTGVDPLFSTGLLWAWRA